MTSTRWLGVGVVLAAVMAGCPAGDRRADEEVVAEPRDEAVLVSTGGPFEIHVVDGKVVQVVPGVRPGEPAQRKAIRNMEELRTLYEQSRGEPLPEPVPGGGVQLNGWAGMECVRVGHACGTAPEAVPQVMVIIRFR